MSEAFGNLGMMGGEMEFGALLERVLRQRSHEATPPAGLVQRLNARLALEAERSRPLSFVEAGRSQRSSASMAFAVFAHACVLLLVLGLASRHMQVTAPQPCGQHGRRRWSA
jgi:hypothetical protein